MRTTDLADLDLKTILSITGIPSKKEIINPRNLKEMSKNVRVTFRPLPKGYDHQVVIDFRDILEEKLKSYGVQILPWNEVTESDKNDFFSKLLRIRKVERNINAVIDVYRPYSLVRKILSRLAERIYKFVRKSERPVMEILKISGWADDFTARFVKDPFNTQIVTIMPLNREFADDNVPYRTKINIGLQNIIKTMSEVVIGVSFDKISIINMNLSDSTFTASQLDEFILNSLIPKLYAPIKPPVLNRFEKGEFNPQDCIYAPQLANLGKQLRKTDLFPKGSSFSEKIPRLSHRDVVEKLLEGRTGVSYGFIALAEPPKYLGRKHISKNQWDQLSKVNGLDNNLIRENDKGRWYIKTLIRGKEIYQQIPDIWIVTSRSGSEKTNLDPSRDIVRIGLIKGKLFLQIPRGIDLSRRDIRPSFDTYVILAQAMSSALYTPDLIKKGMPILHFHGYPDPDWFENKEYHAGANNPSMPCGTIEAALLNYSGVYYSANQNGGDINLLCLVESDHGVNILGPDENYLVERLTDGTKKGSIMLGGKYLPYLKESSFKNDSEKINA